MIGDTAVLLVNHGAADTRAGVEPFLFNIFSDLDIIPLPGGSPARRRLARLIASRRAPKVARLYEYMGGGSPLVPYMRAQARGLEAELAMPVRLGLRYYPPRLADALSALVADDVRRVVVFPQYPQWSDTTVGSVLAELDRARDDVPGAGDLEYVVIDPFGGHPGYVALVADLVRTAAAGCTAEPALVFSAHSVPMSKVEAGDPYPGEIAAQAHDIAVAAGFGPDGYEVAFQSRAGPVRWLGPEVRDVAADLVRAGRREVLVVPVSFVQDHLETLVEIDVQLSAEVEALGGRLHRVRSVNADRRFVRLCAALVREALAAHDPVSELAARYER
ncbi:MAG: ferrochelatase [Acidimicrobiia bacterium]|nr:ferrochelatase [Acidimicrobiia bacterium]